MEPDGATPSTVLKQKRHTSVGNAECAAIAPRTREPPNSHGGVLASPVAEVSEKCPNPWSRMAANHHR